MEVLIITVLITSNLACLNVLIIYRAIIKDKNAIIDAKEKIIASMVEKDDYQS